nr:TonB-dependent receptor [Fodinibius sp.]NIV14262.1 TonB-dependent receptor [Fodinibius sp.]NIY28097.1 TonB-dependent receptor [Fodinibius sp.]
TRDEDDSYRQNDWLKRWSGSSKLEWEISPFQQLTLTGNYMRQKRGNFLYWRDLNNALQPPINQVDDVVISNRYYLTGQYRHVFSPTRFLTARGIWFWNRFEDTVTGENGSISTSKNMNGEVQFNTQLGQLFLTAGIEATYNTADSDLFGDRTGIGSAAYIQSEISLSRKLKTTLGTRLDYFDIDSVDADARVNPKLGVVYKPMKGTAIRASSGLGFRAPSMAEVFTSTNAGGLQVIPNNELKPEKSIYGEIGANQLIGRWLMLDVAGFYSQSV